MSIPVGEITIYICDTNLVTPNTAALAAVGVPVSCLEILDNDRCEKGFPRSRKKQTEERLLASVVPRLDLLRIMNPLASFRLPLADIVTLLESVVDWAEPFEGGLMLLIALLRANFIDASRYPLEIII